MTSGSSSDAISGGLMAAIIIACIIAGIFLIVLTMVMFSKRRHDNRVAGHCVCVYIYSLLLPQQSKDYGLLWLPYWLALQQWTACSQDESDENGKQWIILVRTKCFMVCLLTSSPLGVITVRKILKHWNRSLKKALHYRSKLLLNHCWVWLLMHWLGN